MFFVELWAVRRMSLEDAAVVLPFRLAVGRPIGWLAHVGAQRDYGEAPSSLS